MERIKNCTVAAVAVALLAATAGAADNAGMMVGNAGRAVETLQSGLGAGVSAEQMASRGLEGQQILQGLDTSGGVAGAVDASKSQGFRGFARIQGRHAPQAGVKADTVVPTPVGYHCFGPGCAGDTNQKAPPPNAHRSGKKSFARKLLGVAGRLALGFATPPLACGLIGALIAAPTGPAGMAAGFATGVSVGGLFDIAVALIGIPMALAELNG